MFRTVYRIVFMSVFIRRLTLLPFLHSTAHKHCRIVWSRTFLLVLAFICLFSFSICWHCRRHCVVAAFFLFLIIYSFVGMFNLNCFVKYSRTNTHTHIFKTWSEHLQIYVITKFEFSLFCCLLYYCVVLCLFKCYTNKFTYSRPFVRMHHFIGLFRFCFLLFSFGLWNFQI